MLTFIDSMSLSELKEMQKAETVDVCQNPSTGKYFFTCGDMTGAVSRRYDPENKLEPVVSFVENESGDTFYLLHCRHYRNTRKAATF